MTTHEAINKLMDTPMKNHLKVLLEGEYYDIQSIITPRPSDCETEIVVVKSKSCTTKEISA